MNAPPNPALLPQGLQDKLPEAAEAQAASTAALLETFATHGYQRVDPPLVEFEDTLLAGAGQAVADQVFRLQDPASHRMMGLRADMTPQIARIATTRLAQAPRPLRLSYAGACLRVARQGLSAERQVSQAGIELLGPDGPQADAEVITVGAEALAALGLHRISFDLTVPPLVPAILEAAGVRGAQAAAIARALDRKDAAAVRTAAGALADTLEALLLAAGAPERALAALSQAALPPSARALSDRLVETIGAIRGRAPAVVLTVDPVEARGFHYHTGIAFAVFAPGRHEELGRGGRYLAGTRPDCEPATGLSLFTDAVLRAAPARPARPRIFLPFGTPAQDGRALRAQGAATIAALCDTDAPGEARRLRCTGFLRDDAVIPLDPGEDL